jgi:hypothetical protein
VSPLYFTEIESLPTGKVEMMAACAVAAAVELEAVPKTATGLPTGLLLFSNCNVPVGAAPLLVVEMIAVIVRLVAAMVEPGTPVMEVEVCAGEMVTARGFDWLAS